ncbi:MAG: hypothetical protein V2I46_11735 [Bacteroides sp.]|jgi:hypothetical protein|nr:hypothetical protein [Bacteroides sp.]
MRPIKSLSPLTTWLLRLGVLLMVGLLAWPNLEYFNFTSLNSILTAAFALFAILLFFGGFTNKHTLTMVSGLLLFLLAVWHIYWQYRGMNLSFAAYALTGVLGLHFFVNGNK